MRAISSSLTPTVWKADSRLPSGPITPRAAYRASTRRGGGLHDGAQRLLQFELAADGEDRLEEAAHPVTGAAGRVDARLELLQQFVQPQLRQPYARVLVPLRGRVPPGVRHPCASCPRTAAPPARRPAGTGRR